MAVIFDSVPFTESAVQLGSATNMTNSPMDFLTDDAVYVLGVLHQMRDQVQATPALFDPNALQLIDAEIARYQNKAPEFDAA